MLITYQFYISFYRIPIEKLNIFKDSFCIIYSKKNEKNFKIIILLFCDTIHSKYKFLLLIIQYIVIGREFVKIVKKYHGNIFGISIPNNFEIALSKLLSLLSL